MDWIHSAAILLLCILLLLKGNPCPRSLTCSHKQRRAQSVFSWLEASVLEFHSDTFRQGSVHNWDVQLSSSGNTDSIKSCWFTSVLLPPQPFRGNFKDKKKKKKIKQKRKQIKKPDEKVFFFFRSTNISAFDSTQSPGALRLVLFSWYQNSQTLQEHSVT